MGSTRARRVHQSSVSSKRTWEYIEKNEAQEYRTTRSSTSHDKTSQETLDRIGLGQCTRERVDETRK